MPLSPNGYEAILFDLDGTIRHLPDSPAALFFKYCAELGLQFGDDALHRLVRWQHAYWADNDQINADRARGEDEFWIELARKELCFLSVTSDVDAHARTLTDRFREYYENTMGITHADTLPTLRTLRKAGFTVGLVSNRPYPLDEQVTELELEGLFHFTLSAGEANSWKPDPEIFALALEMAGARAEATVYVGDNYYADVVGARGAGLTPVLFDPHEFFPEVDCTRIAALSDVLRWLGGAGALT
ncbi:MAG: HAD family hydrolase [Anaerolineales bacterium]